MSASEGDLFVGDMDIDSRRVRVPRVAADETIPWRERRFRMFDSLGNIGRKRRRERLEQVMMILVCPREEDIAAGKAFSMNPPSVW